MSLADRPVRSVDYEHCRDVLLDLVEASEEYQRMLMTPWDVGVPADDLLEARDDYLAAVRHARIVLKQT